MQREERVVTLIKSRTLKSKAENLLGAVLLLLDMLPVGAVPLRRLEFSRGACEEACRHAARGKSSRNHRHICCTSVPLQAAAAT